MALSPGTRLGAYDIVALIGAGGMGEVYRARDTKLNRDVAIKVLPDVFANDPERLARFQREAQVLASLNHPHIAHIHGLEESGGVRALVMELVEGEDLAQRVGRGAIPLDEALPIARQIAEALEAAHEQGIIHRDLKPANIKVRSDGTVKVLDFGLAKALGPAEAGHYGDDGSVRLQADLSHSPTITSPAMMTGAGMILGTAAYMSPEQARGKVVDKRSDIWAFGCVLYEMLTGRRAFEAEDVSMTLSKVLQREPDFDALPARLSPALLTYLRRCLQKDPRQRVQAIGDVRLAIDGAFDTQATQPVTAAPLRGMFGLRNVVGLCALIVVIGSLSGAGVWLAMRPPPPEPKPVTRFALTLSPGEVLWGGPSGGASALALSPDGTRIAYATTRHLYLHDMARLDSVVVGGVTDASAPFFSPDGTWLAFLSAGKLRKIPVAGGPSQVICDIPSTFLGGSWSINDTIVFGRAGQGALRVEASGGTPTPLTTLDTGRGESGHAWPEVLPDGTSVMFTVLHGEQDVSEIAIQSLGAADRRVLIEGGNQARYLSSGHLVYLRDGTLFTVPFAQQQVGKPAVSAVEGVQQMLSGYGHYAVSRAGTLVYEPDSPGSRDTTLVWVDRRGQVTATAAPTRGYIYPRLSPDGQKMAVAIAGDIWTYEISRGTLTRLTYDGRNARSVWTPDGMRITISSSQSGVLNVYTIAADGSGATERLTTSQFRQVPEGWSPDGRVLAFTEFRPNTGWDMWTLTMPERKPQLFLQTPYHDGARAFSPDGRWLAYFSDESGRGEVYVRPYPGPGGKVQISTEGGAEPVWARNGRELFYRTGSRMMSVPVTLGVTFSAGKPQILFEGPGSTTLPANFDVSADGNRFLMVVPSNIGPAPLTVTQNWFDEVKRLAPAK